MKGNNLGFFYDFFSLFKDCSHIPVNKGTTSRFGVTEIETVIYM